MSDLFLRFDVEDWLTPAADWALEHILDELERVGARANFAVVGLKARALVERGRTDLLQRMAHLGTVGFHSYSHSLHPTLAEELEPLAREEAESRFVDREGVGVRELLDGGVPPVFFTQPGANWVPEVLERGPDLGLQAFISESWNTYLHPTRTLYWYGRVLYWSPPVDVPKGLLFRLPAGAEDAVAQVARALADGGPAMVVTHPTELVTHYFWDQDNFGGGVTRSPLIAGPALPEVAWEAKLLGFRRYLEGLHALRPRYVTVSDWLAAVRPAGPVEIDRATLHEALAAHGLDALFTGDNWLSAAEAVLAAALLAESPGGAVRVPRLLAPSGTIADTDAAAALLEKVRRDGRLPERVGEWHISAWAPRFLARTLGVAAALRFTERVRPARDQHWDWPIFPPGFTAERLLEESRRQAWTLKPAILAGAPERGTASPR